MYPFEAYNLIFLTKKLIFFFKTIDYSGLVFPCCIIKVTGLFGKRENQIMIIKRTREKEVVEMI